MNKMIKRYSDLIAIPTFEERFEYLQLNGRMGEVTFGSNRYLNQTLYKSNRWFRFRDSIIIRDNGCDLGIEGYEIYGPIIIHHINPITAEDILDDDYKIFDPNNAIATTLNTHNAIHYSDKTKLILPPIQRTKDDTCPWKNKNGR